MLIDHINFIELCDKANIKLGIRTIKGLSDYKYMFYVNRTGLISIDLELTKRLGTKVLYNNIQDVCSQLRVGK